MTDRSSTASHVIVLSVLCVLSGCGSSGSSSDGKTDAGAGGNAGARANGGAGAADDGGSASGSGGTTAPSSGGASASGGSANGNGGAVTSGGASSSGGAVASGGASSSGGSTGSGGFVSGDAGKTSNKCKRGIAANAAPGAAFSSSITWWYNWASQGSGQGTGIEFAPMIWGGSHLNDKLEPNSKYLLTFNEPNFKSQGNLTPAQAAADWPKVEARAAEQHLPIVGPAMNYCGPADQCNGTDPYQYLKDFFAACKDCKVDYVAVHWYNCDLPSLEDYLEPGGNLPGFEQFGKPIWLTEFSCGGSASVADQEAYMKAAIPYLESNPFVYRYSWFSAGPIPNAELMKADGSPTDLGNVYTGLPQACDQ